MKHFGIFDSAEDLQDALNAGAIENDYVALVDGDLDYNTMSPEEPCYIGEWSDDGEGNYTFDILDTDAALLENDTPIATAHNIDLNGYPTEIEVTLCEYMGNGWAVKFIPQDVDASEYPIYNFVEGESEEWNTGLLVSDEDSDSTVRVDYDGGVGFTFYSGSANNPLNMTTINLECE